MEAKGPYPLFLIDRAGVLPYYQWRVYTRASCWENHPIANGHNLGRARL